MLSFFPKPYPDELLYSILARYHVRSGNLSPKLTLKEVFNSRSAIATADLPCNLELLSTNLEFISHITVEDLIQKYTLYPFYAPFLPRERSHLIAAAMRSQKGGSIHDQTGIRASSIPVPKYFRFCPTCLSDDQKQCGEVYWHRVHQVPGVLVCPHHGDILQDSSVPLHGINRHEYITASVNNCRPDQSNRTLSEKTLGFLKELAQDAYCLLENEFPSREMDWFQKQYVSLLIERGLATASGRVWKKALVEHFLFTYNQEILQALGSIVQSQDDQNWLTNIVRKHRKAFHPIRHLLMIRFLNLSVETFLRDDRNYQPFGSEPWLCLNAAAEHYLQPVITNLVISQCYDTKKPVGTFSCSCGFIYCRTGPDQTEAVHVALEKLKRLVPSGNSD